MTDKQGMPQPHTAKLDAVGKLRIDTLYQQIQDMTLAAPRDIQKVLIRTILDDGAQFFRKLVARIGDTAARDIYTAHLLIGSTPPSSVGTLDLNGEGEAEIVRIHGIVTAATAQTLP